MTGAGETVRAYPACAALDPAYDALIASASVVLDTHIPDEWELCVGCWNLWGRWMPYVGCPQVHWARRVAKAYGTTMPGCSGSAAPCTERAVDARQWRRARE
jgi:hypothetical protein